MSKIKLAIADDNKDFCDILYEVLGEEKDIEISWTANDGRKVLEEIQKETPDVLILDKMCIRDSRRSDKGGLPDRRLTKSELHPSAAESVRILQCPFFRPGLSRSLLP